MQAPTWSNWFSLGGVVRPNTNVSAVSAVRGGVSVFHIGTDNNVWSAYYDPRISNPSWSSWFSLGGSVRNNQDITAISPIDGGVSLFQRGDDGYVRSAYYDPRARNAQWLEWFVLGR